jgi:hypothetical protein
MISFKINRVNSPNSVLDSSSAMSSQENAVQALKKMLIKAPESPAPSATNQSVQSLKQMLRGTPVHATTTQVNVSASSKTEALKQLLLVRPASGVASSTHDNTEVQSAHCIPCPDLITPGCSPSDTDDSVKALKAMLLSASKSPTSNEHSTEGHSSPITNSIPKKTPPRSKRKASKVEVAKHQSYFAGSSFQNSPDPLAVPLPDFDESQSRFFSDEPEDVNLGPESASAPVDVLTGPSRVDSSLSLKRLLKI